MKIMLVSLFSICFGLLSLSLSADVKDNSTGEIFPSEITIDQNGKQYKLQATGVATRKKLIIKVYSVASYLETPWNNTGDKFEQLLQDTKAHQLTMKWVRDVPAEKIQEGYRDSINSNVPEAERAKYQKEVETYIGFFTNEVKKGDEYILRWLPGGILQVIINGKEMGTITNKDFARDIWNIWFGPKSVVDRDNLTSFMK